MTLLWPCFAITTLALTASVLLNVSLPAHVLALGGSVMQVGLLVALTRGASMVMRPIAGGLVDRYGPRIVLVPAVLCLLATSLAFHLVHSPWLIVLMMIGVGIGVGGIATSSGVLVASSTAPEQRGRVLTIYYLSSAVAIAIGPTLGLLLTANAGMPSNFAAVTALALLVGGVVIFLPLPARARVAARPGWRLISWRHPLLLAALMLASLGAETLYAFLPLHAKESGLAAPEWFFVTQSACLIGSRLLFPGASDRFGRHRILSVAILAIAAGFILLSLPAQNITVIAAAVLIGIGQSFSYPTLLALAVDRTPPEEVGVTTGTFSAAFDLSQVIGAIVVAAVVRWTWYGAGFLLVGVLAACALALLACDYRRARKA